ncbi:amidase family protein [Conexibacter woesei]|uniref:amidase family protein n=1 Tax=Conexibacter woesei TaxID=191495 RepID=UPI000313ABB2|nr:amidase family protein [Conexibacter woesei]
MEICEGALARARRPEIRDAFIALTPRRARSEAAASATRRADGAARGTLDGVPVAWKDNIDVAGVTTTAGSRTRLVLPLADADAPVVRALREAGATCIGKTNLSEYAFSGLGVNRAFGTPLNPHGGPADDARIPGGSSSGAAVAVAGGAVPVAVGTDTSGSVRVPASFCGVVGYSSTVARYDRSGVVPLSPTLDGIGVIAHTVRDATIVADAMDGRARPVRRAPAPHDVRIVVPEGELTDEVDDAVGAAFAIAIDALADAGVLVVRRTVAALSTTQRELDEHGTIVAAEAARTLADVLDGPAAADIDAHVRRRALQGRAVLADGYEHLLAGRPALQAELAHDLRGWLVAYPTVRMTAPKAADLDDDATYVAVNARVLRSTMLASHLDMPGVSVPCGTDKAGLPVGLLLSGPAGDDDRVLGAARTIEHVLATSGRDGCPQQQATTRGEGEER